MKVNDILNKIYKKYSYVFTNDNGRAIVGGKQYFAKKDSVIHIKKGDRVTIGGSPISYGLYPGSSDTIGWQETVITPDMVGQTIAVFTSIEIKTENDKLSDKQRKWNRAVRRSGGIVEVWHGVGDEIEVLKGEEIE